MLPVNVNVSNIGAGASGFTSGAIFTPVYLHRQDDPDTVFEDD